jgi:hypothetical protein
VSDASSCSINTTEVGVTSVFRFHLSVPVLRHHVHIGVLRCLIYSTLQMALRLSSSSSKASKVCFITIFRLLVIVLKSNNKYEYYIHLFLLIPMDRTVGIVTRLRAGRRRDRILFPARARYFFFFKGSRPALGPTHLRFSLTHGKSAGT